MSGERQRRSNVNSSSTPPCLSEIWARHQFTAKAAASTRCMCIWRDWTCNCLFASACPLESAPPSAHQLQLAVEPIGKGVRLRNQRLQVRVLPEEHTTTHTHWIQVYTASGVATPTNQESALQPKARQYPRSGEQPMLTSAHSEMRVKDTLAERLRRRPAKPMGSPRVGSNPTGVVS